MKLSRLVLLPVVALTGFAGTVLAQEDLLTPTLRDELRAECNSDSTYMACVNALALHGDGNDKEALDTLLAPIPAGSPVRLHYKLGKTLPNDGFWKLAARAGAPQIDCRVHLPATLGRQFLRDPDALAAAAEHSGKNPYTGLSDLLLSVATLPGGGAVNGRNAEADVYRYCFGDATNLFAAVKHSIGQ